MKKKITGLLAIAVFTSTFGIAQNFSALYDFDSLKTTSGLVDPTPVPVATNVTFGSFTAVGTPSSPNAALRFSYTSWPTGATAGINVYDSLHGSIDTAQYYEVTVTPNSGYTIDLTSITFSVQRSGSGIRTYAVRSSIDNYANNLTATIVPANANLSFQAGDVFFWNFDATTSNQNGSTVTLGGPGYTNVGTAVTFRFYGWNAEAGSGTFSIDNVIINGSVNGVVTALYSANNVCEGDSMHFTDMSASTLNIIDWAWDFGGGSPMDSVQNPVHYFTAAGMHVVSLTVTDDSLNTDTYTDTVYVYPKPVSNWAASTSGISICAGSEVDVSNLSDVSTGSIASYAWNFGDSGSGSNNNSVLQSPSHSYTTAGTYQVELIVTSDMGCKDTSAAPVTIAPNPVAAFSFSESGGTVSFTESSTGASVWYWDLGDPSVTNDTSSAQSFSYTYPLDFVNATVCLTVSNSAGCTDMACEVVMEVGVEDVAAESRISVYPSPSKDGIFTIDTKAASVNNAVATVYTVLGKAVYTKQLLNNKETLDLSAFGNGAYFIILKSDASVVSRKIVINK